MIKTSELIKALQEHMERNGDMNVRIHVRDSSLGRTRWQVEEARIYSDYFGNIVKGAACCAITAQLEKGCKITAPKELKESRLTLSHEWQA